MSESAKTYSEQRLEADFDVHVLLSEPLKYTLADLADALSGVCGSVAEWQSSMDVEGWGRLHASFDGETIDVTVFSLPAPVPIEHYEASVRRAIAFPGAKSALEAHKAHISISAASDAKDLVSRFKTARIVTCVAGMFARLEICAAILFPSGDVIAEPGAWQNTMQTAMHDEWPIDGWISFEMQRFPPETEGGLPLSSCGSVGMAAFNGHEVSFVAAPVEPIYALKQVFGSIYLLLASGNQFSDGDTVGLDGDDVKLRMRHAKEGFLDVQTNTWMLFHPEGSINEHELFPPTESVPPPPGLDASVQPRTGFFARLLRLGQRTH